MKFGIDRVLSEPALLAALKGRRVGLLAHPASVTADLTHSVDALMAAGVNLTAAFGPQHGMKGDLQDNMMESPDETDPVHGIPVFSLYGEVRRPSGQSMGTFDIILIDLQDLGCRIYTFITTLLYVLEAAAEHGKAVCVLDRPNPAGRPVEGTTLSPGWESFVGAGPMPMRHGMTLGELGHWFIDHFKLDVEYRVIAMQGYDPDAGPGFGWPLGQRAWINPSPNAPNLSMARAYPGTVMVEGATLSEGRGTTRPLELFGAPDIDARAVIAEMRSLAPQWLGGCILRDIWFSRPSTNTSASCVPGCRFTSKGRVTTTRRSGRGGSRLWHSRRSGGCIPTTTCGGIFRTNMRSGNWPSTSSTAGRDCANGSMTRGRCRAIWMRWPGRTRRPGWKHGGRS